MPPAPAASAAGYRHRPASNQLKEIVEENLEALLRVWDERFRDTYGPLHRRVGTVLDDSLRCGDVHFGSVRLLCCNPDCPKKTERILPYASRGRGLCPSCGQKRALAWAERMVEEVLPIVPYRQLVFTIPRNLRKAFLFDRSLYGDLCRVAYASTRDFLRREAAGTFRGVHGVFLPMDDVDFSGLEEVFRERFFRMMLRREKVRPQTVERMRAWEHSGFAVNWERRIDRYDREGLQGLLSYLERAPVSLRRLTCSTDGFPMRSSPSRSAVSSSSTAGGPRRFPGWRGSSSSAAGGRATEGGPDFRWIGFRTCLRRRVEGRWRGSWW